MNRPSGPEVRRARELRGAQTDSEGVLWRWLRGRRFRGVKFRRQHPIGPYVLDFYSAELRLAIEADGGQHARPTEVVRDERRTQFLESRGVRVLRVWNNEILTNPRGVQERIWSEIEAMRREAPD